MVIEAPFQYFTGHLSDKMKQVNLGDRAVIQWEPNSYHEGMVTLINFRGINISTNCGDRFVKWRNVVKVIKNK